MQDRIRGKQMKESNIVINGMSLSTGQAMTVRIALEAFWIDLISDGLGEDEHGKTMTQAYINRIREIREIMNKE